MWSWFKALWRRHRRWLVLSALAFGILDKLTDGLLTSVPGLGPLLDVVASVLIIAGLFLLYRWLVRRFLFRVSRRLGLAFLFVGVFPLFWFAFFVLGVGATFLLHLASHDSHATLEEYVSGTDAVVERAARVVADAPSPDAFANGWQSLSGGASAREGVRALVWIGDASDDLEELHVGSAETPASGALEPAPGSGTPPAWLFGNPFRGLVAMGDSVTILAARPGQLRDGRPFLALVTEPLGDRVAQRIRERTGIVATRLPVERYIAEWRRAQTDTLPVELDFDGSDAGEGETDVHMTLSGEGAESILTARVVDWRTGELIFEEEEELSSFDVLPIYTLAFEPREYIQAHFTETGQGDVLWLITKVLAVLTVVMTVIASIIGIVLTVSVTRAVSALHRGTRKVAEGDLDHLIEVKSKDQLGALAASFNEMTGSVKRLLAEKAEKDRLVHEMEIAAQVQDQMLPERFPKIPGLEGAARCMMAKEVGGDFYDFIPISPKRVGFAIGDVSGKGVSAALVMSNVMSSLRSMLAGDPSRGPAELLRQLNKILHHATAPDRFVTLFYAEYDLSTANLRYANAGHDWPMVVSPEGQLVLDLESSGLMLGALPDIQLTEHEIKLEPGDVVVAYSDGLVDTENEDGEPFDRERAQSVIADHIGETPRRVVDAVSRSLREWQGNAEDVDDVTIIVLKRVALPGTVEARMDDSDVLVVR